MQYDRPVSPLDGARGRTLILVAMFVFLIGLIALPSFIGRIQYAMTKAELTAISDSAANAELATVGKLFTSLARLIGPAVVNVSSKRTVLFVADEIGSLRGTTMKGGTDESIGSGVLVDSSGIIVTNYHVVSQVDSIEVKLADGRRFDAQLLGADAATDLAVLKIDAMNLPVAQWGDSNTVEAGEMVWAIGNPFGLDRTITYGIVSAIGRRGITEDPFQEFLQTDASINPGNSGGPLVDVHGAIMGITTAIVGQDYQGIGFAIPSNTAKTISDEIILHGHVERGYLGMALRQSNDSKKGISGAMVFAVDPNSPSAVAGIRPGDIVIGFNGERIPEPTKLVLLLTRASIGGVSSLQILRDDEEQTLEVRIGRRPLERRRALP